MHDDHEVAGLDDHEVGGRPSLVLVTERARAEELEALEATAATPVEVTAPARELTFEQLFAVVEAEDDWQERALCSQTDPEAFFPEKGGSTREAKRICTGCEVRDECLEYALAHDERFGIWGGLSERERRRLKRAAVG